MTVPTTGTADYSEKIPNNVSLHEDRRLQRALESWQPNFLHWWQTMGPTLPTQDVYLRTAVNVGRDGWAQFGHVAMPEYRWGIFLAERDPGRKVGFGEHKGEPVWDKVPGEYRAELQRLKLPHIAFNRKVGAFAGIEATPDGEKIPAEQWQRRQGEWLPTDVDKTYVRSLMQPVHQRGKIAAWIAPPRNGINGQPFDYDYVHLA